MKNFLEKAGYVYDPKSGVWMRQGFVGIPYSDGDDVEEQLANIISTTTDLRVLSDELKQHITDWPTLYHLSSNRANILRPFDHILPGADVLEIGAGCGAITRYLGECGAQVLALEGSARRAAIARARVRDLHNVEVLAEEFVNFRASSQFDIVTLIGVLEYANQFLRVKAPVLTMLQRAKELLKPGGVLLIAIENQLGVKYWAGAPEDHLGMPMYGVEGRYSEAQPQTFGRKHLRELLDLAGFKNVDFLSALPDYKLPASVVTPYGLESTDFDAAALASQSVRRDPQLPSQLVFSPELVWPIVIRNGLGADLANSFLIAASASCSTAVKPGVLAYHFSTERVGKFCKQTIFRRSSDGSIGVHCNLLDSSETVLRDTSLVSQVNPLAPYVHGHTLSSEFVHLVTRDGWLLDSIGAFLRRYLNIVLSLIGDDRPVASIESLQVMLPGKCFDLVPQNIVRDYNGDYHAIDREWTLVRDMPVGWLLFRSLLLLVQGVTRFGEPGSNFNATRQGFFVAALNNAGFEANYHVLQSFGELEAAVQAQVTGRPIERCQNWWPDSPLQTSYGINGSISAQAFAVQQGDYELKIQRLEHSLAVMEDKLSLQIRQRDDNLISLQNSLFEIRASKSWRITAPLRKLSDSIFEAERYANLLRDAIKIGGGLWPTLRTTLQVLRNEGVKGISWRMSNVKNLQDAAVPVALAEKPFLPTSKHHLVPYYPNPLWDQQLSIPPKLERRFAVHCHLDLRTDVIQSVSRLSLIPFGFDLYVSIVGEAIEDHYALCKNALPHADIVKIEYLPPHAQPITTLLTCFGEILSEYPSFAHFAFENSGVTCSLQSLIGPKGSSGGRLVNLLELMEKSVALILSAASDGEGESTTCAADATWIKRAAQTCGVNFEDVKALESVRGACAFLMRGASLRAALPIASLYDQSDRRPEIESRLSEAITTMLPVLSSMQGQILKIQQGESVRDFRYFEKQRDYSDSILYRDIKVLSYYLPQFHPTPENDEWHGAGFTEWTKVAAANPLFEGHYQQHIPHPDIGYYLLDSPGILHIQAEQMRKAGVYGQIFYHYWFSGRMILEKPAKILLANTDIPMPFCFCWANENWTRRWDGNEREILLGQKYSSDDAKAFIRYLIPFFKDSRYICVGKRPLLMVYRPSSIPNAVEYIEIWAEECRQAGLEPPYVVAVLTRGATNPADFHMDAGVERVLHDWTDGAVPDIRSSLKHYWPMDGSVLSYEQVRDFYTAQNERKPFDYFRSNVPMWDNTARYGSDAMLLHGSTPQSFQQWMEHSIAYANSTLTPDRRFVVVNAWNEWAEGTHLEPDTRYGYSYLNSVGRALSALPYTHQLNENVVLPDDVKVHVHFAPELVQRLVHDEILRSRFFYCIDRSTVLRERGCCGEIFPFSQELALPFVREVRPKDLRLDFRDSVYFAADVIENLLATAYSSQELIICNDYGQVIATKDFIENGAVGVGAAITASIIARPLLEERLTNEVVRIRTDAWCFALRSGLKGSNDNLPVVTVIVRFHQGARLTELRNALSCLHVMQDCIVIPHIAAQDLNIFQRQELQMLLSEFKWSKGYEPYVVHFSSVDGKGDLRSRMLNESLRQVRSRYAAFLDYDDLLFPDAYAWLIDRLRTTGKAVAFGRVYSTGFSSKMNIIKDRRRAFEYGYTYEDFLRQNHAPLHSILLDCNKLNFSNLIYFDDQCYMEDYLMTLQLFGDDNCDWDGLHQNKYIGDYIHSIDRSHTLALSDDQVRETLLRDPNYIRCDQRISDFRKRALLHKTPPLRG